MVVWMRVNRSPSDWPDQLLTNIWPDSAGAISPPVISAPWQVTHLASYTVLPWAAWSGVNTPLHTLRAGVCALSADAPRIRVIAVMVNMIFGIMFFMFSAPFGSRPL